MEPQTELDSSVELGGVGGSGVAVGPFEGPDADEAALLRSREARKIVKLLRSRTRKVLHELGEGLLDRSLAALRSVLADPEASRMEKIYAAESSGRLLAAAAQVCTEFGVDNLQAVVEQQKRQRRALQNQKKQLQREEHRKQKYVAQAQSVTAAVRAALRSSGSGDAS